MTHCTSTLQNWCHQMSPLLELTLSASFVLFFKKKISFVVATAHWVIAHWPPKLSFKLQETTDYSSNNSFLVSRSFLFSVHEEKRERDREHWTEYEMYLCRKICFSVSIFIESALYFSLKSLIRGTLQFCLNLCQLTCCWSVGEKESADKRRLTGVSYLRVISVDLWFIWAAAFVE